MGFGPKRDADGRTAASGITRRAHLLMKEVEEQATQRGERRRVLPLGALEEYARLGVGGGAAARVGKIGHRLVLLDSELDHVEHVVVEHAAKHKIVRPLL